MLERARSNIPAEYHSQVEFVHADIFTFRPQAQYDLALCIGVLAHVDSIDRALERVASCVKPGGRVVVQISDDDQVLLRVSRWVDRARNMISRSSLHSNRMALSQVVAMLGRHHLEVMSERRHLLLLFPGMARVLGRWLVPYDLFTQKHPALSKHGTNVILVCRKISAL
jgi:trans-aconitate methyltransferase